MKIDIVYKVVHEYEDQLVSAMHTNVALSVLYQEYKWNYPNIGKIFVFNDMVNAFCFARGVIKARIFKCAALNCVEMRERLLFCYANEYHILYKYWKGDKCSRMLGDTPKGTLGADAIYLLEEI